MLHAPPPTFPSILPLLYPRSFIPLSSFCACYYVQGVTGFLTSKDYSSYYGAGSAPLLPGTLLDVVVSKAPLPGPEGTILQVRVS